VTAERGEELQNNHDWKNLKMAMKYAENAMKTAKITMKFCTLLKLRKD
jgi:hypothetical protein